jgi:hypothetical protein
MEPERIKEPKGNKMGKKGQSKKEKEYFERY